MHSGGIDTSGKYRSLRQTVDPVVVNILIGGSVGMHLQRVYAEISRRERHDQEQQSVFEPASLCGAPPLVPCGAQLFGVEVMPLQKHALEGHGLFQNAFDILEAREPQVVIPDQLYNKYSPEDRPDYRLI